MTSITQIGLGPMGSALADCLITKGYELTVWNRTSDKTRPFVDRGATSADTIEAALKASETIIVCVNNYKTSLELFSSVDDDELFAGRTIIQLSTGRPHEVHQLDDWLSTRGASYLDGSILGAPQVIGDPEGFILVAGREETWTKSLTILQALAGNATHAGEQIDAASILDLAWLCQRLGLSLIHI